VATANAALYCGASVEFVDIDLSTFNMCVKDLERKLITAKQNNRLPKVVTPVHLCGQSCDMAAIKKLSDEYDFRVVEDASHAVGGQYSGRPIGCCEYSDISIFSFHPVKIITTGEGGVATTNDQALADSMRLLRSHGITRNEDLLFRRDGDWYYEQQALGFNYRMTEMSAALGCSQLRRLELFVQSRNELAAVYDSELASLPLHLPKVPSNVVSSRHLYVVRLKAKEHVASHAEIFHALRKFEVGVNLHYIPVYRQPYYSDLAISKQDFVNSEIYYESAISIPLFHDMTQQDQETVIDALRVVLA
jgi:dTDP-4-amino-4,6-dideoxygalactose transaminase